MAYESIELGQPGNPKCPDAFTNESTLICPDCKRIFLQISKQAVFLEFGIMPQGKGLDPGLVKWQTGSQVLPMVARLGQKFDAVRVRNYTKGSEAQVVITVD